MRTPLNAILGYTELLLDNVYGDTPDKMREVLDRIQRNGRQLLGLINDVLDLSKIEAGQLHLSLADYSLKDVVQRLTQGIPGTGMASSQRETAARKMPPFARARAQSPRDPRGSLPRARLEDGIDPLVLEAVRQLAG